jgi:lysozyme
MLDTFNEHALEEELAIDEGKRRFRYRDTRGHWTIGIGHNLDVAPLNYPEPWSDAVISEVFQRDIVSGIAKLDKNIPWWRKLTHGRQRVLINMTFNLGWGGLATFTKFLELVKAGNYPAAADDMLTTLWAKQVGARATRLSHMMRAGD